MEEEKMGRVLGITGSPGSGKTTVAEILEARGFGRLDADREAHTLYEEDQELRKKLAAAFGKWIFDKDGHLDRRQLGEVVFSDPDYMRTLNNLVHPALLRRLDRRLEEMKKEKDWVVLDAALLVEWKALDRLDKLLVVIAPEETRLERFAKRQGLSMMDARARTAFQSSEADKSAHADHILENNGSVEDLPAKIDEFLSAM